MKIMQNFQITHRPRRLRHTAALRRMVAGTTLHPSDLVLPIFVKEDITKPQDIAAMPGVQQHSLDSLVEFAKEAVATGVGGLMLFGIPKEKDSQGSQAWSKAGILNRAIAKLRKELGNSTVIMADTCLDEFTDHGHCGVIDDSGNVINDDTLELYAKMAVSQAKAGAHLVAPSGMMDGQVGVIRAALDKAGFENVGILAYTAKYASAFFGPFREAVDSSFTGNRNTYQQNPANRTEARYEYELDIAEGADIAMVKPAMSYLDIVSDIKNVATVPVAAYQVSGEYSMIEAAAANGWLDRDRVVLESLISIKRAGADIILTYFALEVAKKLAKGEVS
ncbi:MAG: porphobilinogen synthase [Micrococcaceae bacterium]